MIIIGTSAYCGSGQDTLADAIVKKYGFEKHSLGDFLREMAQNRGIKPSRENLQMIRKELDKQFGRSYIPERIAERILNNGKDAIITGLRTLEEYSIFKEKLGMYFIFVFADKEIRFKRLMSRATDRDPSGREEFEKQNASELAMFDVAELEKKCDFRFVCNMTLEEFWSDYENLLWQIPILRDIKKTSS